jgi:hypothetical protein
MIDCSVNSLFGPLHEVKNVVVRGCEEEGLAVDIQQGPHVQVLQPQRWTSSIQMVMADMLRR